MTRKKHFGIEQTLTLLPYLLRVVAVSTGRPVVVGVEIVDADSGKTIGVLSKAEILQCVRKMAEVEEPESLKEINNWNYMQMGG